MKYFKNAANRAEERCWERGVTSIRDVASLAGVSLGTVSNVINRPETVTLARRQRVLDAIDELGFIPNSAAWHFRQARRPIVGLLSPNVSNPFFTEVARGVEEAAFEAGYAMHLCHTGGLVERELEHLRVLESQSVSAVVVTSLAESTERLKQLHDRGVAVVMLGRNPRTQDICSVSVNDLRGGALAAEHVVGLGHTQILWLASQDNVPRVSERQTGFVKRFRELRQTHRELRLEVTVAEGQATAGQADAAISKLLLADFRYTALVCFNDEMALGAMRALARVGVRIPEEVSVVGYDDIDYAAMAMVPLTTIRQPMRDLGRTAVALAIKEVQETTSHIHQRVMFDPKLIQRASTRARQE